MSTSVTPSRPPAGKLPVPPQTELTIESDGTTAPVPPVVEWGTSRLPGGMNNGRPQQRDRELGEMFGNSERDKWVPERSIKEHNDIVNLISSRMTAFEMFASSE